jgi:hypothetical protein
VYTNPFEYSVTPIRTQSVESRQARVHPTVKTPYVKRSPEKARVKTDDKPRCKKRPDSRKAAKGNGSGRKDFIPWCG